VVIFIKRPFVTLFDETEIEQTKPCYFRCIWSSKIVDHFLLATTVLKIEKIKDRKYFLSQHNSSWVTKKLLKLQKKLLKIFKFESFFVDSDKQMSQKFRLCTLVSCKYLWNFLKIFYKLHWPRLKISGKDFLNWIIKSINCKKAISFLIKLVLILQWTPLNRITLGHEQFDSNNRIWPIDTIIRIFVILHNLNFLWFCKVPIFGSLS
jgi:hypothetical protein